MAIMPSPYALAPGQTELSPEAKVECDAFFAQLEEESVWEAWHYMYIRVPDPYRAYFLESHPDPHTVEEPPALDAMTERQRRGRLARGDHPPEGALAPPVLPPQPYNPDPNFNPNLPPGQIYQPPSPLP